MMLGIMDGVRTIFKLLGDLATFIWLILRPHGALAAENLFLRKRLAMYRERKLKPIRPNTPIRIALVLLFGLFNWRDALVILQSQTLVRWHRRGFRLFWHWKSQPGRPRIPMELKRLLYALIVIEHQSRWIVHCNVTTHPTPAWTLRQLRKATPSHHGYRFLVHDRDGIFSPQLDQSITRMGLRVLGTPPRSPKANSLRERVIGTFRRKCLDFPIPLMENHLRIGTKNGVTHYNRGRPHASLGPGIPDPPVDLPVSPHKHRHRISTHLKVVAHPVLGGLHHEYGLLAKAA